MTRPGDGDSSSGEYFGHCAASAAEPAPSVVAGRYHLGAKLGAGTSGVVYRAADRLAGVDVAVKLLDLHTSPARIRREAVALRGLRIPGVVRLLDEGIDRGRPFLVMELVEGAAFPGCPAPARWQDLHQPTRHLLEALGRVHAARVVHLDLKPANVHVKPDGTVVLLDLGLAAGDGLGGAAPRHAYGGTRRYAAPEQLAADGRVDARSDLYAVGIMLAESILGRPLTRAETSEPARLMGDLWTATPEVVQATIRALLSPAAAGRPGSAWEVIDLFGECFPASEPDWERLVPSGREPLSAEDLARCFHGPERLFHLPSRSAELVHRMCGGSRGRALQELRGWLRAGIATLDGSRLRMIRPAPDAEESSDKHLADLVAESDGRGVPRVALEAARAHLAHGRLDRARLSLEQALFLIRRGDAEPAEEESILFLWAQTAFEERSATALELTLYEVGRAVRRTPLVEAIERLVKAASHAEHGDPGRARALLDGVGPFADPALEMWRYSSLLQVAAQLDDGEATVLERAHTWARHHGTPDVEARVLGWLGLARYRQGRFAEAAALQERAADLAVAPTQRLAHLLNGGSAWMEAGDYPAARRLASVAHDEARRCHQPVYEARAEWLLRAVAYRAGDELIPDLELVEASTHLDTPYLEGLIALNEAAVAWRRGSLATATTLGNRACRRFTAASLRAGQVLARAVVLVCEVRTAPASDRRAEIRRLAAEVLEQPIPDVDWQVLGLLCRLPGGAQWHHEAESLARRADRPDLRRELLAPNELHR